MDRKYGGRTNKDGRGLLQDCVAQKGDNVACGQWTGSTKGGNNKDGKGLLQLCVAQKHDGVAFEQ